MTTKIAIDGLTDHLQHYRTIALMTDQLQYRNIPLMSTSLTDAFTIGTVAMGAPSPTNTTTPPERVA